MSKTPLMSGIKDWLYSEPEDLRGPEPELSSHWFWSFILMVLMVQVVLVVLTR